MMHKKGRESTRGNHLLRHRHLQAMPWLSGRLDIAKGVTAVADYALAGCSKLTRVSLSSTLARRNATSLQGLEPGTYIVAGAKIVVK